jgi:hypothetical protein
MGGERIIFYKSITMGFEQYHEPVEELSNEVRTFARMIKGLVEEAEAIDWYEQRMAVEKNIEAKEIMNNAQTEEMKHFSMDLEFLIRQKPEWKKILQRVLFRDGNIVKLGEKAEEEVDAE